MKRLAAPALGAGIVLVLLSGVVAVVAAPSSSGVKACENSKRDLAVLSGGHCPKHYSKVKIAKSGPRGPKGSRGPTGPGAATLSFKGGSSLTFAGTSLGTVDGVAYTVSCTFTPGSDTLQGILNAGGPAFDLHEVETSTLSNVNDLQTPSLTNVKSTTFTPILGASAGSGQTIQTVLSTAVLAVHGPPVAVQSITGYISVTDGGTQATSTCDLEGQVTPSS